MKVPKAKAALDKDWTKLGSTLKAWDLSSVRPRAEVEAEAQRLHKKVHFGSVMDLCHEKHAELALPDPDYKGRVVFRGDQVRDEAGFYAVFF